MHKKSMQYILKVTRHKNNDMNGKDYGSLVVQFQLSAAY